MTGSPQQLVAPFAGQPAWLLISGWLVWAAAVVILTPLLLGLAARLVRHTRSQLDDVVLRAARGPVRIILLLIGAGVALEAAALPERFNHYARPTLFALIALTIVVFADRLARGLLRIYLPESGAVHAARSVVVGATRGLVIAIGALIVLDSLGISITPLLATLGVGSLAVALALQDTLGQLFAGIYMAVDQPIRMGDYVRVGSGEEGIVEKIGWRSTRLRMMQNSLVIIPNAKLAMSTIVNFHLPQPDMTIQIPMTVAYGTDLDRAASIALEVAREVVSSVPGGVPSPEPSLRYGRFGDAGIELNLAVCVAQYTDQFFIRHETIVRLDRRFREAGIVIPYPVREVRLGTEERELLGGGLPAARPGP